MCVYMDVVWERHWEEYRVNLIMKLFSSVFEIRLKSLFSFTSVKMFESILC